MYDPVPQALSTTRSVADKLRYAKSLIEDPYNHARFMLKDGEKLCSLAATAVAFGCDKNDAIALNSFDPPPQLLKAAGEILAPANIESFGSICEVNNFYPHEVVMSMFDRAIALAEGASWKSPSMPTHQKRLSSESSMIFIRSYDSTGNFPISAMTQTYW